MSEQAPFYLVVETSGSNAEHDGAKLDAFLEDAMGCALGEVVHVKLLLRAHSKLSTQ